MALISVVMPVYNTPADILSEAANSILDQTFADFEFIIIDDCSDNKETLEYLDTLDDIRVRKVRNKQNIGITKSLNIGLKLASGKYIARMDGDDIALPQRFERQYAYMEAHPDVVVCGSNVKFFGNGHATWKASIDDQELYRIKLLFGNMGPSHPSVMYRREKMLELDLWYDEELDYSQDYMMWVNASKVCRVACIDEVLLLYRRHEGQVSAAKAAKQKESSLRVREKQLRNLCDHITPQDVVNHYDYFFDKTINEDSCKWYRKLIAYNDKKGVYDRRRFRTYVTNLIAEKFFATYDINWKDPRSYGIMLKFLPVSYVMNNLRKKIARKLSGIYKR